VSTRLRLSEIFCGLDWAERHHGVALVEIDRNRVARLRVSDDSAGFRALTEPLARHGDSAEDAIPVAIEAPRGLLPQCLCASDRTVYAISPLARTAIGIGARMSVSAGWTPRSRCPVRTCRRM